MTSLDIYLKVPEPDTIGDSHRNIQEYSFNLSKWVEVIAELHSIRNLRVILKTFLKSYRGHKGILPRHQRPRARCHLVRPIRPATEH